MPVPPRFDGLGVVEVEILATSKSWGMLRDFLAELSELEKQDWISFRNDMYALQDLASQWSDKVKEVFASGSSDAVTLHLSGQLERIKAAAPTLKYCHGKDFKDEHWSALLQGKLGLARDVRLENLRVGRGVYDPRGFGTLEAPVSVASILAHSLEPLIISARTLDLYTHESLA